MEKVLYVDAKNHLKCHKYVNYDIYRVSQEECARLWEGVPDVKIY